MTREVTAAAPAKINLYLGVGPVRPDGFHGLATVYQAIGLYDDVTVSRAATSSVTVEGLGVEVSGVPADETNLAVRAAVLLAGHGGLDPAEAAVAMTIRKRIPVAGGMAGGSTDAAAALVACDALWGLRTPPDELAALAARLGSDVPFCLVGGTAVGTGRGEVVNPVAGMGTYRWVVALPGGGLSTPGVYAELDRLRADLATPEPELPDDLIAALGEGDVEQVADLLANDMETAALSLRPELGEVLAVGREAGALAAMVSGSGPTCLFLAADDDQVARLRARLEDAGTATLTATGPVPGAHVTSTL